MSDLNKPMSAFYRGGLMVVLPIGIVAAIVFAIIGNWGAAGLFAALVLIGVLAIGLDRRRSSR